MSNLSPVKLSPAFKDYLWGGTKLKEQYNPNVMVTGDYYTVNYNNYGFAHFIAKYLNTMYPPVGDTYSTDLPDSAFDNPKTITDTISIANNDIT